MPPMAAAAAASSSMSVGNYSLFLSRLTANLSFPSSSSSSSSTAATKTRKPKPHQILTHPQPLLHHHHLHLLPFFSTTTTSSSSFVAASAYDDAAVNEEEEEEEEVEEKRRLYVGNLPYSMTSSQLADIFQEAGQVHAVEIVYDRVTDRSRGFAFVTMGSVEEAKQAIRMFNGSQVGGRSVKVNFPEVPRGGEREIMGPRIRSSSRGYVDSPYKVYAGNLGWRLTSETLKEAFESQPGLLGAKVIYERDSGRSRGFGFVSFASPEEAESAIDAMNGVHVWRFSSTMQDQNHLPGRAPHKLALAQKSCRPTNQEVEGRPLRLSLAAQKTTTAAATETTQEIRTDTVGNEMQSTVAY